MATLFTTLISALGGGGGAAGGAAAGAAAGAASGGIGLGTIASVATTVVGGLASLYAGAQAGAALDQQAVDEETRAVQETINGRQDALDALRRLNRDTAAIAVAGYASGIGGEGSVAAAQEAALNIGEQNLNMARDNARIQSAMRRGQARQLRAEANAERTGGIFGAVRGGLSLFERRAARG